MWPFNKQKIFGLFKFIIVLATRSHLYLRLNSSHLCTDHTRYFHVIKLTVLCVFVFTGKPKRGALSELTGTVSRAAGRKITRIISFSKRKPPLPGDIRGSLDQDPRCGRNPVSFLILQCQRISTCYFQRTFLCL